MAVVVQKSAVGHFWYTIRVLMMLPVLAAMLPIADAANKQMAERHFWPPKSLAGANRANTAQPGAVSGDSGKKDRRDRKRERQMAAFRRSQRG